MSIKKIKTFKSLAFTKSKEFSRKQVWIFASIIIVLVVLYFAKGLLIAATVNGAPIGRLSVVSELEKQGGQGALDSLITKSLILNEARKRNITVSKADVDSQMKKIQTEIESQGSTLDQELISQGMTRSSFSDQVKLELLLNEMVGKNATATDKEVSDYIAANKDQFPQGEIEATAREQTKQQITQQKLQQQLQDFVQNLRKKAKIIYFVNY